jgi:hypothetical protein
MRNTITEVNLQNEKMLKKLSHPLWANFHKLSNLSRAATARNPTARKNTVNAAVQGFNALSSANAYSARIVLRIYKSLEVM